MVAMPSALDRFSPYAREWFTGAFGAPTLAQEGAWEAIAGGKHALVVAPTGSGKTLAAFLWALDRLLTGPGAQAPEPAEDETSGRGRRRRTANKTRVLYISPLKALGADVERNLRSPLVGITQTARFHGEEPRAVSVGVRSGDTPARERRQLLTDPPDVLITTPESLYLMLTSKARSTLSQVETVIVDEVHAVAGTKRGAHLAVSLERLDQLLDKPAQRIGLSATVEPVETVARFLGGTAPVETVRPPSQKEWDLTVSVPVPDLARLTTPVPRSALPAGSGGSTGCAWQDARNGLAPGGSGAGTGNPSSEDAAGGRDPRIPTASLPEHRTGVSAGSAASASATLEDALGLDLGSPLRTAGQGAEDSPDEEPGTAASDRAAAAPPTPAPAPAGPTRAETAPGPETELVASIWPHVEERIVDLVEANRSTIVFANSRGLAERLTSRLNEIHAFRQEQRARAADDGAADAELPYAPTALNHLNSGEAPADLARAHHGSVSKEQRALIEDALKSGTLRCVVATSSLELGIDMGAVDLVVQVESPPSVASGLQRVGRAGHQVGVVSHAVMYPKHRGDLLAAAVTTERMRAGAIEPLSIPANPLDVLAQQTVAATALGRIDVEAWFEALRRTAPFASLPRAAFDAVLDLLAGKYPSDEFAELRPRIVWDRDAGVLEPRPGAQRTAVTSGGTIPDRGLYPVFIVGSDENAVGPKRVGELDEEMVYESRAGDVIALGATSWRIEEITHDRVNVTPAPGQVGKLPFWHGDGPGRPVELGEAMGRFVREVAGALPADGTPEAENGPRARLLAAGLDEWAVDNLLAYLADQKEATGQVPHEKSLVVERFRDELGDWRVILHSPYGMPVHSPWALAVGARLEEKYGLDGSAMAADDGIVLRVPAMEDEPPGAELFLFDPEELEAIVTERVGSSALFASRFRECSARALLLPRRDPGKRTPLWQQRQRSAQLLDVARKHPDFPIILETVRECLQDVYDLPALTRLHRDVQSQRIAVREVETQEPSPFAKTLLFGYVGQFLYNPDAPLAERKAAALSLDPTLLAELLGRDELRELLDAETIEQTEAELQRLAPERQLRADAEGLADLLRLVGPLSLEEAARRLRPVEDAAGPDHEDPGAVPAVDPEAVAAAADSLVAAHRALRVRIGGQERVAAVEDAARLRDALGVALPMGVPTAFIEPVADPLGDLVARYARTHGPFTAEEAARALGLGTAVVVSVLERLAADRRVVQGRFLPPELLAARGRDSAEEVEWCDAQVLRGLRRRSLAKLRAQIEPVDPAVYARFLPAWQHVHAEGAAEDVRVSDADGLLTVIDQLAGVPVPASALESLVLPARVKDYRPGTLDAAMSAGEVLWTGAGTIPGQDGWVALHLAESADLTVPEKPATPPDELSQEARDVYAAMGEGADFVHRIAARAGMSAARAGDALWELTWAGLVTNDTLGGLRAFLEGGSTAHAQPKARGRARSVARRGAGRINRARGGGASAFRTGTGLEVAGAADAGVSGLSPQRERELTGRWSRVSTFLDEEPLEPTVRAVALAQLLLDRYGVLTRGSVALEEVPGGFTGVYQILTKQEDQGEARRGYFVEGLGGAQFAAPATVDVLRAHEIDEQLDGASASEPRRPEVLVLAATDPAQPYGAALTWPDVVPAADLLGPGAAGDAGKARPGRKAGALVVLVDGRPVLYVERGGKTMLAFSASAADLELAAPAVARAVRLGAVDKLVVEKVNGVSILERGAPGDGGQPAPMTALREALMAHGFYSTPRGVRMRK